MYKQERYLFRAATEEDIRELAAIEKICFSENEACNYEEVKDRVEKIPEDFLIAFDQVNKKITGYMSGIHSASEVFLDEFFRNASLHEKGAKHCFLLGLEVRPEYQGKGIASQIMNRYIDMEEKRGTEKIFLTCHSHFVPFYSGFGYEHLGKSPSTWGGESWEDMVYQIS